MYQILFSAKISLYKKRKFKSFPIERMIQKLVKSDHNPHRLLYINNSHTKY